MAKSPHGRAVEKMAAEIGYVCIHWAWLEDIIDFLIALLAPIDNHEVGNAITGNVDIRQKAQMLRALFFLRKGRNNDWYKFAIETINTVDNDLRARRNHLCSFQSACHEGPPHAAQKEHQGCETTIVPGARAKNNRHKARKDQRGQKTTEGHSQPCDEMC
jgi:hypothetical protein